MKAAVSEAHVDGILKEKILEEPCHQNPNGLFPVNLFNPHAGW